MTHSPTRALRICVIGDGGWGTALALLLSQNGHDVAVWGAFPDYVAAVARTRENARFLPGIRIPDRITWTASREGAAGQADIVVLAVPTRFFASVLGTFSDAVPAAASVVSVAKGLDAETGERMSRVAERTLGRAPVAALTGPSHAEEVARGVPTAVVVASPDPQQAKALQHAFANRRFRVYTTDDVTGAELGGALKNVIAIAVGISDGLGFGDNTRAALITRGLAEVARLGRALGADPATFSGLSGMGDLIVTCTSRLSRNRGVGERIGRGETLDEILRSMQQVAEGVWNCRTAHALGAGAGVDVPIIGEVHEILYGGKDPRAAVESLLSREYRAE
jgi:glycerol-3-phosphate dehydrogenase (NAD(P)+)